MKKDITTIRREALRLKIKVAGKKYVASKDGSAAEERALTQMDTLHEQYINEFGIMPTSFVHPTSSMRKRGRS